ncbi:hypothetical protein ACQP2P_16435 [Dactylosporangium sp. CA-139114]|uniref:hypothetical protein n=1 Tax=Dactylosporangium sp. CA-139114 TaxID=3239931 RepID=UPI003D9547E6
MSVQQAQLHDAAAVGDVLASALADSAVGALLTPGRAARKRMLRQICTALAAEAVIHGMVHLRSDGAGAAIWLPTGVASTTPAHAAQPADSDSAADTVFNRALDELDPVPSAAGPAALSDTTDTVLHAFAALLRPAVRPHHPTRLLPPALPSPARIAWPGAAFLLALGVDPDARRDGVARQLLAHQHATLDAARIPAVAVAMDPAGHQLYTTAGYQPHHVDPVVDGLAVQWLVRPPDGVGAAGSVDLITPRHGWSSA